MLKGTDYLKWLATAAIAFAVFSPLLRAPFLFDDTSVVEGDAYAEYIAARDAGEWEGESSPGIFDELWTMPRPLRHISHRVDCALFGVRPAPAHAVNIVLHLLVAAAGFALLKSLGKDGAFAGFAVLLFLFNPVVVESVGIVSHRKEMLSALFCLCSLALVVRRKPWWAVAPLFFLAMAGKETSAVLPLLWLAIGLPSVFASSGSSSDSQADAPAREKTARRFFWRNAAMLAAMSAALSVLFYFQIRAGMDAIGCRPGEDAMRAGHFGAGAGWGAAVVSAIRAFPAYLRSFVSPIFHTVDPPSRMDARFLEPSTIAALLAVAAYLVALWKLRANRRFFAPLAWIGASLSPYIFPPLLKSGGVAVFADRYAYMASFGFAWFAAECLEPLGRLGWKAWGVRTAILAYLAFFAHAVAMNYTSNVRFWGNAARLNPRSFQACYNHGYALWDELDDAEAADAEFDRMMSITNTFAFGIIGAVDFHVAHGNFEKALAFADAAAECMPDAGDIADCREGLLDEILSRAEESRRDMDWPQARRLDGLYAMANGDKRLADAYRCFTEDPPPRDTRVALVVGDAAARGISAALAASDSEDGWVSRSAAECADVAELNAKFAEIARANPDAATCVIAFDCAPADGNRDASDAAIFARMVTSCAFKARQAGMRPVVVLFGDVGECVGMLSKSCSSANIATASAVGFGWNSLSP